MTRYIPDLLILLAALCASIAVALFTAPGWGWITIGGLLLLAGLRIGLKRAAPNSRPKRRRRRPTPPTPAPIFAPIDTTPSDVDDIDRTIG